MSILRYYPLTAVSHLQDEINKLFSRNLLQREEEDDGSNVATSQWIPAVDIIEESERFVLHADIPGVNPKDISVFMEDGSLAIKGERKFEKIDEKKGYRRIERARGTFYRRFTLPDTADVEHITAKGSDGVLEIIIPKAEKGKNRQITVQTN